jgi:hypothetical protein
MKYIDILFIINDDVIYDYTEDEVIVISDYYINIIYAKITDYINIIYSKYFDFNYIFFYTNKYFDDLNRDIHILNTIYTEKCVFIFSNENYFKIKAKYDILGSNHVIFFYFKFKNKTLLNKHINLSDFVIDNHKLISTLNGPWNS